MTSFEDSKNYQSELLKDFHTTENNLSFVIKELETIVQTALIDNEISDRTNHLHEKLNIFLNKKQRTTWYY